MEPYPQAIEPRWREHHRGAGQMGPVVAARRRNSSTTGWGKGRGDAGGQGNERLRVNFYLGVGCDVGLSSGIFSVIWENNRVI